MHHAMHQPGFFLVLFVLSSTAWASPQANTNPKTQDDLLVWGTSAAKPALAPFAQVGGYRFSHTPVSKALAQRVRHALATTFKGQCPDRNGAVYRFDVGKDGDVLMTSCKVTSFHSWTVYFQHTRTDALKLLSFRVPKLDTDSNGTLKTPLKVVGFEPRRRLKGSEVLQRRVVSQGALRPRGTRRFRAEWIWKEEQGMILHRYSDSSATSADITLYP